MPFAAVETADVAYAAVKRIPKQWQWTALLSQAIRGAEMQVPLAERVLMPVAESGQARNAPAGFLRSATYFWNEMLRLRPEVFSQRNAEFIEKGLAPRVDELWVQYHPWHGKVMEDLLTHHHVGRGQWAIPVPWSLHVGAGWSKLWHSVSGL